MAPEWGEGANWDPMSRLGPAFGTHGPLGGPQGPHFPLGMGPLGHQGLPEPCPGTPWALFAQPASGQTCHIAVPESWGRFQAYQATLHSKHGHKDDA